MHYIYALQCILYGTRIKKVNVLRAYYTYGYGRTTRSRLRAYYAYGYGRMTRGGVMGEQT